MPETDQSASSGVDHLEVDLNDLRVFVQVVESNSFTTAGKRLDMPRSTVSRRIASLERRLGVRLLHRTTRKLELTELGSTYYERCATGLQQLAEAEAQVKSAQATPRGRLRITAPNDVGRFLAPIVASFLEAYPDVQIDVELSQRVVDMIGEGFDAAIRASGHLPDSSLVARRIGGGDSLVYASPSYVARRGAPEKPHDLTQHDVIVLGTRGGAATTWRLLSGHEVVEVPIKSRLRVNDPSLARDAAVAGLGITWLPEFVAKAEVEGGFLQRLLPGVRASESAMYFVYPSAKHLSATLRAFRDHVVEGFAELPFGGPKR
ncbi:MAG: LysR family transcriptional regulator [Myxococcota bacterium]